MARLLRQSGAGRVSEEAVHAGTGKTREEWFTLLDQAGARMMDHEEISAYGCDELGLSRWWSRTLAADYERNRGMRQRYKKGNRFLVYRSKTIAAPVAEVRAAWQERETLQRWLPGARFDVRRATSKGMNLRWADGTTVGIAFIEMGGKTKVTIEHSTVAGQGDNERLSRYWAQALERLKDLVEV
jgi:Activator of Hsp90 ATPase homolog 1-like protein